MTDAPAAAGSDPATPPRTLPGDPVVLERARTRRAQRVGLGAVLLAALWTFWPLGRAAVPTPDLSVDSPDPPPRSDSFAPAAFDTPLWTIVPPPTPPPPAPSPAPPPPLKLQLLGITLDPATPGVYRAVLFDPDANQVVIVAGGDHVAGRAVTAVEANAVKLSVGDHVRTLSLREARSE